MTRTWTFGRKLGAAFAVLIGLTVVIAATGYRALGVVVAEKDRVIQEIDQNLIDAEALRAAMNAATSATRASLLTGEARHAESLREARAEFDALLSGIERRGGARRVADAAGAIAAATAAHRAAVDRVMAQRRGDMELGVVLDGFDREVLPKTETLISAVRAFVAVVHGEREAERARAAQTAADASRASLGLGVLAILVAVACALTITRSLERQITSSVQNVRSASSELQAAAGQQASGAKEQAAAMAEISTTIGELLSTSRQIARSAQHVAKMAAEGSGSAGDGEAAVERAREAVAGIRKQVDGIVEHMLGMGRKSQEVGAVVDIINELAEQTNILAINAAIEAAGAGESGRRFAVVGEEIRKLADRVAASAREIRGLIEDVRASANASVMATESGSKAVESGIASFADVQGSLRRIAGITSATTDAGREIELSTKQQATAVEQVNLAISNVAQAMRESEASAQQTLQTASQLAELSSSLSRVVKAGAA